MPQIPTSDKERGPRSLKRMALAVALRNIASITDVGEMAFADARPILTHIENPHQLHLLETNCPQLAAEPDQMAAVWGRLLTKKVPGWDTKGFLTDEELQTMSWIDIYTTVKTAIDAEMAAAEDRLRQTLAGFSKAKEDNSTQLVNNRALTRKIPGVMTKKRVPGGVDRTQAVLNFGSGSRTKMTSGQSVLRRARREAKEISKVSQMSSRLTENQTIARSQIRQAPASMMHDHRVAHQPGTGIIRPPKKRSANPSSEVKTHYETEGRYGAPGTGLGVGNDSNEARLLALKTGGVAAASSALSYSAGPAAPAIHAPRKRAVTSTTTATTMTSASSSEKPKAKRPTYDFDDDDELFGVVTKPTKRARLTIEDLEGGGSGNGSGNDDDDGDRDLFGSDEEPRSKPKSKSRPVISNRDRDDRREREDRRERDERRERDDRRDRDRDRERDRRDDRSYDRSYDSPPKKPSARPSAPVSSSTYKPPPPTAAAGSPPRAQAAAGGGPPRKKAVDIFMRPKRK